MSNMGKAYKPKGYNSLSPYFIVAGAQKMIAFLQEVFGAEQLRRYDRSDGSIMHAELQIDDSIIMLGESTEEFPPNQHLIHLYVSHVDTVYQKAIALGCRPIEEPKQKEGDPDRRGSFTDFAGNVWAIGTQIED